MINPLELDLFGLEVKTRKMVHDLINPLVEKMNIERGQMAMYNERAANLENRLISIECMHGLTEAKPKIFQEIDNHLANIR